MKVFISHSSTDKKFVRKLKIDLNENDIETWVDEDELDFGDSLLDKLNDALEDSSHFLIVLSPASINSEWVKFELEKALNKNKQQLLQKIIPIKYKDCNLPAELEDLLYADLSKEIREVSDDKIRFTTSGYGLFLNKICTSIRNSEKTLTTEDKRDLRKELESNSLADQDLMNEEFIRTSYLLIGYRSREVKLKYARNIKKRGNLTKNLDRIKPILLPPLLKYVFDDLKIGERVYFSKNYFGKEFGHFGGFRKDDIAITLDPNIGKALALRKKRRYRVEIDVSERKINFLTV